MELKDKRSNKKIVRRKIMTKMKRKKKKCLVINMIHLKV